MARHIEQRIEVGELQPGEQLPTEIEMREQFEASRNTIRDAIRWLVSRGLVETRAGMGCFVARRPEPFVTTLPAGPEPERVVRGEETFALTASRPRVEVHAAADNLAAILRLREGARVVSRRYERFVDRVPWSLETSFHPMDLVTRGAEYLAWAEPINQGALAYLEESIALKQVGHRDSYDNISEIIANASDGRWREIVIFASGLGNVVQTNELLGGLLHTSLGGQRRYERRLLAVACLDEIRAADPGVLADVERAISDLLPPHSLAQAEALSHTGHRLIPLLAKIRSFRDADEVVAMIRAAALVGGPKALDVIARIASRDEINDSRLPGWPVLRGEYMRSWQYFIHSRYVERVLLPAGVADLEITNPLLLGDAADLPDGIGSITLMGSLGSELDLSAISGAAIPDLRIVSCDARRIAGLGQPWKSVRQLRLEGLGDLVDIPAVRLLPNIEMLVIVNCGKLADYTPFGRLANLRMAYIEGSVSGDIKILADRPNIEHLTIMEVDKIDLGVFRGRNMQITVDKKTNIAPLPVPFWPTIRRM